MIEIYRRHTLPESMSIRDQQRHDDGISGVTAIPAASHRTRNPVIHMYVFPHRSKADGLWIPGYWTSFELYERVEAGSDKSED